MATVYYPAIIEKGPEGFGVYFPDLPGCVSAGATAQEAAEGAQEALEGHLAVMAEYGDPIPEPSAIDAIEPEADSVEVARMLVVGERPGRAVRVQITMEEGLVTRIDRVAKNRSRFLAEAAAEKLGHTWSSIRVEGLEPAQGATMLIGPGTGRKVQKRTPKRHEKA